MTDERRIAQRFTPKSHQVKIKNRITDESMGTVANISSTGFMLVTPGEIEPNSIFQVELTLLDGDTETNINMGIVCLWAAEAASSGSYWGGFHVIDISAEAEANLNTILPKLE